MYIHSIRGLINKPGTVLLVVFLCLTTIGMTFAQDKPCDDCKIPLHLPSPKMKAQNARVSGETTWHVDVNSSCQYSDHYITLGIDVEPDKIKNPKIKLTTWDIDYNDPQGCRGGPEVDYLYVNGNFIGQLQGANNSWSINIFSISSSYLVKGSNQIYIDTDAPGTGCWCVGVGYVEISGLTEFTVTKYTPSNDEKNVKWDNPGITIEFSNEVKASTANDSTIILDYRDQSGNWVEVATDVKMVSATTAQVTPSANLKDGIRYRMRVLAGPKGALDKNDNELTSDSEWVFWTMVDLGGQTANVYKPNVTTDKMQITWFNVSRNEDLIPIKTVVNRIYALWDEKADVFDADEVTEFDANVTLEVNGSPNTKNNYTIKRPDKYTANEKSNALNTINFRRIGSTGSEEKYELKIETIPQTGTPKVFEKDDTAKIRSKTPSLEFNFWACEMAGWYNGVNAGDLTAAKSELTNGCHFTWDVFPIEGCTKNDKGTISRGAGGFNMVYTRNGTSSWWPVSSSVRFVNIPSWFGITTTEIEEMKHVLNHLATLKPKDHKFIVGLVPNDGIPGLAGARWDHVILLSQGQFNAGSVAHEIGHEYGIDINKYTGCTLFHNNDGRVIEGFNVDSMKNKSYEEGNTDSGKVRHQDCASIAYYTPVIPLMNVQKVNTELQWIRPDNYRHLMSELGAAARATAVSALNKQSLTLTGDFMVVQGYIDGSSNIKTVLPLYNVTERHVDAPSGAGYTVELFSGENGTGSSLGSYDFSIGDMVVHTDNGEVKTISSQMFVFTIPFDNTAQSLVIKGPNNTVRINKSEHGVTAPTADFTYPTNGSTISGIVDVAWSGSDDGGTVHYGLEYSPDGTDWIPISNRMVDVTTYSLDTTLLPTGTNQKLALIASDGFQTTRKEISITIDNYVKAAGTSPLNNETDVSELQAEINAYFVSDLDESTINTDSFKLFEGSNEVGGTASYDIEARMASFRPTGNFKANTTYTARLVAGKIKDTRGNTLESNYEWTFTTGKRLINPQVDSVSPSKGAMNVPIDVIIQATFEDDVDSNTVGSSTFTLKDNNDTAVAGTVSYNAATKGALFTPSSNLATSTTYVATLTTAIADSDGLQLESDYVWSFTTGSEEYNGVRIIKVNYDQAEDTNDDGLYEKLIIRFQVEVVTTGTYNLNCQLVDKNGEDIEWTSKIQSFSTTGVYSVDLEFDGAVIASHGVDGPFEVSNIYIYNTYNANLYDSFAGSYQTYPYKADAFYSVIRLSDIPEIAVASDSTNDNVINLENYASHATYNVYDLTYSILINSNTDAGVSIDANYNQILDINPVSGFSGYSDVTIEAKDKDGVRALDTFRVSVLKGYKFANAGWYLISLTSQPVDTKIATVLAQIAGKYKTVWSYTNGRWRVYDPDNPELSDLSTMEAGKGYWINMKQAANLSTEGSTVSGQSINLATGWNLGGLNSTKSIATADALSSIAGRYLSVWAYIDGAWKVYDPNNSGISDLTTMEPGYGYWINATTDTLWTLP